MTEKIQKKQTNAATTETPVIADAKFDLPQEKADTKAGLAKATAKKSAPSQTAAGQKDMNSTAAECGSPAGSSPVSGSSAFVEPETARTDTALDAASEDRAANAAKQAKPPAAPRQTFKQSEFIVYPAHGVGQIIAIEEQEVAGFKLELFVISFVKDKMILKVPVPKAVSVRMRKLADAAVVKKSLDTLTGRARIKRTMWSRRAQEYEAKINSGDLISIAEVVRDLYRSSAQPEQSYSERQLYEAALDRMAREIAVVEKLSETDAFKLLDTQLQKSPRRVKGEEPEVEEPDVDEDGNVEEAA